MPESMIQSQSDLLRTWAAELRNKGGTVSVEGADGDVEQIRTANLKDEDIAGLVGVTPQAWSKYQNGSRRISRRTKGFDAFVERWAQHLGREKSEVEEALTKASSPSALGRTVSRQDPLTRFNRGDRICAGLVRYPGLGSNATSDGTSTTADQRGLLGRILYDFAAFAGLRPDDSRFESISLDRLEERLGVNGGVDVGAAVFATPNRALRMRFIPSPIAIPFNVVYGRRLAEDGMRRTWRQQLGELLQRGTAYVSEQDGTLPGFGKRLMPFGVAMEVGFQHMVNFVGWPEHLPTDDLDTASAFAEIGEPINSGVDYDAEEFVKLFKVWDDAGVPMRYKLEHTDEPFFAREDGERLRATRCFPIVVIDELAACEICRLGSEQGEALDLLFGGTEGDQGTPGGVVADSNAQVAIKSADLLPRYNLSLAVAREHGSLYEYLDESFAYFLRANSERIAIAYFETWLQLRDKYAPFFHEYANAPDKLHTRGPDRWMWPSEGAARSLPSWLPIIMRAWKRLVDELSPVDIKVNRDKYEPHLLRRVLKKSTAESLPTSALKMEE